MRPSAAWVTRFASQGNRSDWAGIDRCAGGLARRLPLAPWPRHNQESGPDPAASENLLP